MEFDSEIRNLSYHDSLQTTVSLLPVCRYKVRPLLRSNRLANLPVQGKDCLQVDPMASSSSGPVQFR